MLKKIYHRMRLKTGNNSRIHWSVTFQKPQCIDIGDNCYIAKNGHILSYVQYHGKKLNPKIIIGNNFNANRNLTIQCADLIQIGDNVLIANDVFITDENHGMNPEKYYATQDLITNPVIINNNVWIGEKVCILPGVQIGENSIIGAGSIVTKSIPPYSIAVGNPAKVIKKYDRQTKKWKRI